jgi:hypothetical protein
MSCPDSFHVTQGKFGSSIKTTDEHKQARIAPATAT